MTGEEFSAWLKAVGLTTDKRAAHALGVSAKAIGAWRREERGIPGLLIVLMGMIDKHGLPNGKGGI